VQLGLDFSKRKIPADSGKRLCRLTVSCSEDFQAFLDLLVAKLGTDRSKLMHRYIVEGMQRDLAELLMPQPHLDESLRKILSRGF